MSAGIHAQAVLFDAMHKHEELHELLRKLNAIGRLLELVHGDLDDEVLNGLGECLTSLVERAAQVAKASHEQIGDVWRAQGGVR